MKKGKPWFKPRANGTHTVTTTELAKSLGITPQSIHKERRVQGHYRGLTPKILPNGRFLWPRDSLKRIEERGDLRGNQKPYLRETLVTEIVRVTISVPVEKSAKEPSC